MPKGWSGMWDIIEPVRKVWVDVDEPVEGAAAAPAAAAVAAAAPTSEGELHAAFSAAAKAKWLEATKPSWG